MESVTVADLPHAVGGKVSLVGAEIKEIPAELSKHYGSTAVELTISHCQLRRINHLEGFSCLKTLVLDNNEIGDDWAFPLLPTLETLWINHNNITRLDSFLDAITGKLPSLTYLSLLKNPCCPNYLVGKGSDDYKRYRIGVLTRIETLKFLDSSPITQQEKNEASELRKRIVRPDPSEYRKAASLAGINPEMGLDKVPSNDHARDEGAAFGQTRYVYYGRHSEGNRFIVDKHL